MAMKKDEAIKLLGLDSDFNKNQLDEQYSQKISQFTERAEAAPTDALKAKYQQQLVLLKEAKEVLQAPGASRISELSNTMMSDLPGAAPSYTVSDGVMAGEGLVISEGTILSNRYEILERIGIGGMGAVFSANDKTRGEVVALKVMLPQLMRNEKAKERFMNEAKVSSNLSHPNIVNVFDVQTDGDLTFLSMELLEGQDLRAYLSAMNGRAISVNDALDIINPIAEALSYAHNYTVHRDVKPENIWLSENGDYKLMDFGIARIQSTSQMTKTGSSLGTAYYMAPEQLKGVSNIDGRADQYAIAVMLYEMLTGNIPTGRIKSLKEIDKKIPKKLSNAVDKALEPDPADRFSDMQAFKSALGGKSVKGASEPMNLSPIFPIIGFAIAAFIGLFFFGGEIKNAIFPDPQVELEAIRLQAEVDTLEDQLDDSKKVIEDNVRNTDNLVRRLEGNLRSARAAADKRKIERELNTARRKLDFAKQAKDLTDNVTFDRKSIATLQGDQGLAESQLRSKSFKDARANFLVVKEKYEMKLSQADKVDDVLYARENASSIYSEWRNTTNSQYNNSSAGRSSKQLIDDKLRIANDLLDDGDFSKANSAFSDYVSFVREDIDWVKAWKENTGSAFQTYIQKHPSGRHSQEALVLLEDYSWAQAKSANSGSGASFSSNVAGYESYKRLYPNGKYITQAEEAVWSYAKRVNSEEGYVKYAKIWPQGKYANEVPAAKESAGYKNAKSRNKVSIYQAFIKNYPSSKHRNEMITLEDKRAFDVAKNNHTLDAYNRYLKNYPNGKYRQQAETGKGSAANSIETNAYASAKSSGTEKAYRNYIKRYPSGKFVNEALSRISYVHHWGRVYSKNSVQTVNDLIKTSDNGFAISGYAGASVGGSKSQAWFITTNSKGTVLNESTFGGIAQDVANASAQFSNGDFVIVGKIKDSSSGPIKLWASRVSKTGQVIWDKRFKGSGTSEAKDVIVDSSDNVIIAGSSYSESNSYDAWVIKLDASGKELWQNKYGTTGRDDARSIIATKDGGYMVAGFTTGLSTSLRKSKARLFKIGPNGRFLWEKVYNSKSRNGASKLMKLANGNFLVQGWIYSRRTSKTSNLLIMEVDAKGTLVWNQSYTGYEPGDATAVKGGNIVATAWKDSRAKLLFLSNRGRLQSSKTINIPSVYSGVQEGHKIIALNNGSVIVSGTYHGSKTKQHVWLAELGPVTLKDVLDDKY